MNVHQFAKLINENSDVMTEEELIVLADEWEKEYELYLLNKFRKRPNTPNTCLLYTSDAADE